jgi:hypothetical protein
VVEYLKNWLMSPEHINHPYPSESEKARMVADTGIEIKRLNNWFVNNRIRFWKPRFEAMQKQQEQKKRKLSKSKEISVSPETINISPPKGTSRRTPIASQNSTKTRQVVVSVPSLIVPRLDLSHLVHTVANVTATVSDDDSCSGNSSPKVVRKSSENSDLKKTSMFRRCRKRQRTEIENEDLIATAAALESSPRLKYTCHDVEQWKLACSRCISTYPELDDTNLPSLDEAALLFGYAIVTSN